MVEREGEQLGNYRLIRFLGEGSFADVYLGEHIYLNRQAAIKVLRTRLAKEDLEGFLIEARTIADLEHPNIVKVLDFGVEAGSGVPFLVMSYAPNGTLRSRHPSGIPLPPTIVLPYVKQIASGLQYAHDKKLIHRDIKPHNLLLNLHNEVWISDFGLVLIAQSTMSQVTQNPAGTPAYMAPEQFAGKPRPASDQYALGVVVYEWLCGERPFHGTYSELFSQHNFIPAPPMREKIPAISPAVDEVVLTALAKDPYKRFANIKAFANALEQACTAEPYLLSISGFDLPAPSLQGGPSAGAGAGATPALESLYSAAPTAPPLEAAPLAAQDSAAHGLQASSPAAKNMHTSQPSQSSQHVSASELAAPALEMASPALAAPVADEPSPAEAARDTYAAGLQPPASFAEPHTERVIHGEPATPDALTLADAPVPEQPALLPKRDISRRTVLVGLVGTAVAVGGGAVALAWKNNSGAKTPAPPPSGVHTQGHTVTPAPPTPVAAGTPIFTYHKPKSGVRSTAWSPDGKLMASGGLDNEVRVWNVSSKTTLGQDLPYSPYKGHSKPLKSVAWSPPDGKYIASGGEDATVHVWDAATGRDVLHPAYTQHTTTVRSVAWSPNGNLIASGSEDKTVRVWNASSGQDLSYSPYTLHTFPVSEVAWSPDGGRIASASFDGTVRIWNASTGQDVLSPLSHPPGGVRAVAWSYDGKYIATGGDDRTIHLWNAQNGTMIRTFSPGHGAQVESVAWSPNGQYIASGSFDSTVKVWKITGETVVTYHKHTKQVWSVSWSPNGQLIASGSIDDTVQLWTPVEEMRPLTS